MKNGLTVKTLLIELGLASGATKFKSISDTDVFLSICYCLNVFYSNVKTEMINKYYWSTTRLFKIDIKRVFVILSK